MISFVIDFSVLRVLDAMVSLKLSPPSCTLFNTRELNWGEPERAPH